VELSDKSIIQIDEEVRLAFEELVEASKALDADRYFKLFDNDKFVGLSAHGQNWRSIHDLKRVIKTGFDAVDKVQSLVFTNVQVSIIDISTAILINEYKQEVLLKSGKAAQATGGGVQVWSKATGDWKIVSVSASNKPTNSNE